MPTPHEVFLEFSKMIFHLDLQFLVAVGISLTIFFLIAIHLLLSKTIYIIIFGKYSYSKKTLRSSSVRGRRTPYGGLGGETPPKRGTLSRLQVYTRIGIARAEVYKRVGKSVI